MCALPEAVSVRLIDCLFGGAAICLSGRQFRALIRISGIGINGRGMSGNKSTFLRHFSTCNNNCKRNYLKIESRLARQRPPPWAMISIRVRQLELLANVETFYMRRHTHTHTHIRMWDTPENVSFTCNKTKIFEFVIVRCGSRFHRHYSMYNPSV